MPNLGESGALLECYGDVAHEKWLSAAEICGRFSASASPAASNDPTRNQELTL